MADNVFITFSSILLTKMSFDPGPVLGDNDRDMGGLVDNPPSNDHLRSAYRAVQRSYWLL